MKHIQSPHTNSSVEDFAKSSNRAVTDTDENCDERISAQPTDKERFKDPLNMITSNDKHYDDDNHFDIRLQAPSMAEFASEEDLLQSMMTTSNSSPNKCSGCQRVIRDRYLLKAVDKFWHEDCLRCSCCGYRLGEVGCTLFTKAGLLLCKRDYLRLFGESGFCCVCSKLIPAFEMVMRARGNVYHIDCFACQQCNHRFCVGDRYYVLDNSILCEKDYTAFVNDSTKYRDGLSPDKSSKGHHGDIDDVMRPAQQNDDRSSGYGSPSPTAV